MKEPGVGFTFICSVFIGYDPRLKEGPMDLDKALKIALKAHTGQKDRGGAPYILHPLRIMMRMDTETEMISSILHDVLEDSPVKVEDLLKADFSDDVVDAVRSLTHVEGETYDIYIRRCAANPLARKIKIADLEDNMMLRHRLGITEVEADRMILYQRAYHFLTGREWTPPPDDVPAE